MFLEKKKVKSIKKVNMKLKLHEFIARSIKAFSF